MHHKAEKTESRDRLTSQPPRGDAQHPAEIGRGIKAERE
jgi:hypothetical protein